jgi:hypothetical protein
MSTTVCKSSGLPKLSIPSHDPAHCRSGPPLSCPWDLGSMGDQPKSEALPSSLRDEYSYLSTN